MSKKTQIKLKKKITATWLEKLKKKLTCSLEYLYWKLNDLFDTKSLINDSERILVIRI